MVIATGLTVHRQAISTATRDGNELAHQLLGLEPTRYFESRQARRCHRADTRQSPARRPGNRARSLRERHQQADLALSVLHGCRLPHHACRLGIQSSVTSREYGTGGDGAAVTADEDVSDPATTRSRAGRSAPRCRDGARFCASTTQPSSRRPAPVIDGANDGASVLGHPIKREKRHACRLCRQRCEPADRRVRVRGDRPPIRRIPADGLHALLLLLRGRAGRADHPDQSALQFRTHVARVDDEYPHHNHSPCRSFLFAFRRRDR